MQEWSDKEIMEGITFTCEFQNIVFFDIYVYRIYEFENILQKFSVDATNSFRDTVSVFVRIF